MECGLVEERLSEYIERTLPHDEMVRVAQHLNECPRCLSLREEMRSILVTCQAFPSEEVAPELIDRILLRTSGRPRTRSLRERLRGYFLRPMLTPRFATAVGLALLFVALMVDMAMPRMNVLASVLSPRDWLSQMDRGVQQIYSQGLKLYQSKNEWQDWLAFQKNNMWHKLGLKIEQLDVPVEGNKKPADEQQKEKAPGKKSSVWLRPA